MIRAQFHLGHDPLIGRKLYPILREAGFSIDDVSPKWVYTDANQPELMDGGINKIIVPMANTARKLALELGFIDEATWETGIRDIEKVGIPPYGTFFYTWFKALARKEPL